VEGSPNCVGFLALNLAGLEIPSAPNLLLAQGFLLMLDVLNEACC
jgi:hypothetical protein